MKLPRELESKILTQAFGKAAPRKSAPPVVSTGNGCDGCDWSVTLTLPCRVISEANRKDHWAVAGKRKKDQIEALYLAVRLSPLRNNLLPLNPPLGQRGYMGIIPCAVTWVHIGPGMDGDNLQRAFKALRDALAAMLGVDDGSDAVSWQYEQRRGENGCEVRIQKVPS
jgi:hypothetical protein